RRIDDLVRFVGGRRALQYVSGSEIRRPMVAPRLARHRRLYHRFLRDARRYRLASGRAVALGRLVECPASGASYDDAFKRFPGRDPRDQDSVAIAAGIVIRPRPFDYRRGGRDDGRAGARLGFGDDLELGPHGFRSKNGKDASATRPTSLAILCRDARGGVPWLRLSHRRRAPAP